MEPSNPELPQLSSYLPPTYLNATSSSPSVATNDIEISSCKRILNFGPKRCTSIEDVISPLGSKTPVLPRHLESELRKRKQAPIDNPLSYNIEETKKTPYSRLNRIFIPQERQASPLTSSEGHSTARNSSPQDINTSPSLDSTIYFASELLHPITPRRGRTSRYLSEGDRREIITRVNGGEKQVTLAREFNVSRAAICNLYKNRWEVLTRGSRDSTARHPKKSCSKKKASPRRMPVASAPPYPDVSRVSIHSSESPHDRMKVPVVSQPLQKAEVHRSDNTPRMEIQIDRSQQHDLRHYNQLFGLRHHNQMHQVEQPTPPQKGDVTQRAESLRSPAASKPFHVHEVSAYSYPCRNLVAMLRGATTSAAVFQQRVTRLVRLLIEETLTCLPHEDIEIKNAYGDIYQTLDERDICAISMENKGTLLLRTFSDISPVSTTGVIAIDTKAASSTDTSLRVHAQMSSINPHQRAVLLLDTQCTTGDEVCTVLNYFVHDRGITEGNIYFVTIISSFEGLQNVFRHFPDVTLITAQVDTVLDKQQHIRPGISDLTQHVWSTGTPQ